MQKSLTKNSIYNVIYTIANILFPFATSIYVSRILLPAGVGKVASAQNIVSYFVTLAALGCHPMEYESLQKLEKKNMKETNCSPTSTCEYYIDNFGSCWIHGLVVC